MLILSLFSLIMTLSIMQVFEIRDLFERILSYCNYTSLQHCMLLCKTTLHHAPYIKHHGQCEIKHIQRYFRHCFTNVAMSNHFSRFDQSFDHVIKLNLLRCDLTPIFHIPSRLKSLSICYRSGYMSKNECNAILNDIQRLLSLCYGTLEKLYIDSCLDEPLILPTLPYLIKLSLIGIEALNIPITIKALTYYSAFAMIDNLPSDLVQHHELYTQLTILKISFDDSEVIKHMTQLKELHISDNGELLLIPSSLHTLHIDTVKDNEHLLKCDHLLHLHIHQSFNTDHLPPRLQTLSIQTNCTLSYFPSTLIDLYWHAHSICIIQKLPHLRRLEIVLENEQDKSQLNMSLFPNLEYLEITHCECLVHLESSSIQELRLSKHDCQTIKLPVTLNKLSINRWISGHIHLGKHVTHFHCKQKHENCTLSYD